MKDYRFKIESAGYTQIMEKSQVVTEATTFGSRVVIKKNGVEMAVPFEVKPYDQITVHSLCDISVQGEETIVADREEVKKKPNKNIVATLNLCPQPWSTPNVDIHTNGGALAKLLLEMFNKDRHPEEVKSLTGKLILTKKHLDFFRGVKAAGLMYGWEVVSMLEKLNNFSDFVEVTFSEVDEI